MFDYISMRESVSIDEAIEYLSSKLNMPFSKSALFDMVLSEQPRLRISIALYEIEYAEKMPDFIVNKYQKIRDDGLDKFIDILLEKSGTNNTLICEWKDYIGSNGLFGIELNHVASNICIDKIFPNKFISGLISENGDIYNYPNQDREETDEWIDAASQRRIMLGGIVDVCLFRGSYQELETMKLKANGINKEAQLLPNPGMLVFDDTYGLCRLLSKKLMVIDRSSGEYLFGSEDNGIDDRNYEYEIYFDTCYDIGELSAEKYCFRTKYLINFVNNIKAEELLLNTSYTSNELLQEKQSFNEQSIALKFANKAFVKFWGNANPLERDTHPDNKDISRWIHEQSDYKLSKTMANKIAQVIRPEWAAIGRKPEK